MPQPGQIIDDDLSVRRALRRLISSAGFAVETFASGREFLETMPHDGRGCLVLDIHLEGMSGFEVKERLVAGGLPESMLLKPNMVIAGKGSSVQASVPEVATATLRCLRRHVPAAVPGIVFLSGGQSDRMATAHLNAINRLPGAQALEDQLLVRARAPGCGARDVAWADRDPEGRPAGLVPAGQMQWRGQPRDVHGGDGGGVRGCRQSCPPRRMARRLTRDLFRPSASTWTS